jgi:transcription elongation GreA/GreB family factor
MDSPLGRALLGKALGAELQVALPAGLRNYVIVKIDYA